MFESIGIAKTSARVLLGMAAAFAAFNGARADTIGWALADRPHFQTPYYANADHSYNSAGGKTLVTRLGIGYYQVDFRKLFTNGALNNVQVSAVNTRGYCESSGWDSEGTFQAAKMWVTCFDRTGAMADTQFSVLYQKRTDYLGSHTQGIAFLWADQPSAVSYTPEANYNFNSSSPGLFNTIQRNSTGDYSVFIPDLTGPGGNAQVSAYSSTNTPFRCKAVSTQAPGISGSIVHVLCFDQTGAAADSYFSLAFALNMPFSTITGTTTQGVYAWDDKPKRTPYTPPTPWNFNSVNASDLTQVSRSSKGAYLITIPASITGTNGFAMVTGGTGLSDSSYCNYVGAPFLIVQCYKQGGIYQDDQFNIAFEALAP